jgi:hypothetical protein
MIMILFSLLQNCLICLFEIVLREEKLRVLLLVAQAGDHLINDYEQTGDTHVKDKDMYKLII